MVKPIFCGVATALVTPFAGDKVDYCALRKLIEHTVSGGADALVVCGTTGEGCALTEEETRPVIDFVKREVGSSFPVIAGVAGACTQDAVSRAKMAESTGADALLVAPPPFVKPSGEGIYRHYCAVADSVSVPIIAYDAPSRAGVHIEPEIAARLCEKGKISGIKATDCNIASVARLSSAIAGRAALYCGNDDMTVPVMSIGGTGVISVLSNLFPRITKKMYSLAASGDYKEAARLQLKVLPFVAELFSLSNPVPIKAVLSHYGFCENNLRLPLTPMPATRINHIVALAGSLMEEEKA